MGGGPTCCASAAASALGDAFKKERSRARSGQLERRVGLPNRGDQALPFGQCRNQSVMIIIVVPYAR